MRRAVFGSLTSSSSSSESESLSEEEEMKSSLLLLLPLLDDNRLNKSLQLIEMSRGIGINQIIPI